MQTVEISMFQYRVYDTARWETEEGKGGEYITERGKVEILVGSPGQEDRLSTCGMAVLHAHVNFPS